MATVKNGINRKVFLVWKYAIKIPQFDYCHIHFVQGCLANLNERKYYKDFYGSSYEGNMVDFVAPSLFCSWFGLFQIQLRCEPNKIALTESEISFFKPLTRDIKETNFGFYKNKLVCLDYA